MNRLFLDSSAFVKLFVQEEGSEEVELFCQKAQTLGLCILALPETISGLNRKVREKTLELDDYQLLKKWVDEAIADASIINLTPDVVSIATGLLERNRLRTLDALHIASAKRWKSEIFLSADKRQIKAAQREGMNALAVGGVCGP